MSDLDEDARHVIGTDSRVSVLREDLVQNVADNGGVFCTLLSRFDFGTEVISTLLVAEAVPDSVACVHDKHVILGALNNLDIWFGGDSLILSSQRRHVLVLEVTDGSAERQVSVDALVADEMVRGINALLLTLIVWLVVLRKLCHGVTGLDEN